MYKVREFDGSITSVKGFEASGVVADVKGKATGKKDVAIIYSDVDCVGAGVFTKNLVRSQTIDICKDNLRRNQIRAIVINSGNANACVGKKGYTDAMRMTEITADALNIKKEKVLVSSTGVIGQLMPMDRIEKGIKLAAENLSKNGGFDASEAIMTTDLVAKNMAVKVMMEGGEEISIAGMAKGSGMIHPNMATMLCYITTDVRIESSILQRILSEITEKTFNMVSVDRDTSTNDSAILLASGKANNPIIDSENCVDYEILKRGVHYVMEYLAKSIARDGEGATKLIEVDVRNALSFDDAKTVGKSVVTSPLVKTAIYGEDANWGRIITAVGYSGAEIEEASIDITVGDVKVCENGMGILEDETEINKILKKDEVKILIDLKLGNQDAKVWGCDLSYDYIKINADYRT